MEYNMAVCIKCEETYSDKRLALGYATCLECGEQDAQTVKARRAYAKLCEMTPYVSGSMAQPDSLFERRPGYNTKSIVTKTFVSGE
tara:strand:- start:46 stop:303 length:258 start_codon:yes stop_codon:yes gene_type:complete